MTSKNYDRVKKHMEMLHQPGNEELLEDFVKKKREADKRYREKMLNSKNADAFKKKKCQQAKTSMKRKALSDLNTNVTIGSKFKSKKGLEKAVKKLKKNMPKEREKQIEVVEVIAEELNMTLKTEGTQSKFSRQRHYFRDVPDLVVEFYLMDSVSRQLPGKNDVITLKSEDGIKEKFQKRVLLTTIEEAYLEFTLLHPDQKIGRSKFFDLRPKYVLLLSQTPHNVCCCLYCSNFQFLFEALKPFLSEDLDNCDAFVMKFLCSRAFDCANNLCDLCMNYEEKLKELLTPSCEDLPVKWTKWIKEDSFLQKHQLANKSVSDATAEFNATFEKFKIHKYLVHTQHAVLNELKLHNDDSSVILHLDYSENFSIALQDEIQSAYFKRKQLSIFTAVAFVGRLDTISIAIINDDTKHQKEQVFYYLRIIIEMLRSTYQDLTHIHFITDGCAAQFKNKFILSNLIYMEADFNLHAKWHFMPTSHGKSCADGIGGSLKRQVSHRILSGLYEIKNAQDFVDCASSFAKNINVLCATHNDMENSTAILKERWAKVKTIPGTQSCHYFEPVGNKILAAISSKKDGFKICDIN